MKTNSSAVPDRKSRPFLYKMFNFEMFFTEPLNPIRPVISRIYNALIKALNKHEHLPRYVFVMPDKDIIASINNYDYGSRLLIERSIDWLLKQIAKALITRCKDLHKVRKGAALVNLPRVYWIKMLPRPYTTSIELKQILTQRHKFNSGIDSRISIENLMDSIKIYDFDSHSFFDQFGMLTSTGQYHYWRKLDDVFHSILQDNNTNHEPVLHIQTQSHRRQLPTPPPRKHHDLFYREF